MSLHERNDAPFIGLVCALAPQPNSSLTDVVATMLGIASRPPAIRRLARALISANVASSSTPSSSFSVTRAFTSSPISAAAASSITSILSAGRSEWPLKDAVKFARPVASTDKSVVWTYQELTSHVSALSSGLNSMGYGSGDRVVSTLAAHTPESAVLLLACARLGVTIISIPISSVADSSSAASPLSESVAESVAQAVREHNAKALFVSGDRADDESSSIVASVNATLHALDPSAALRDSAGIAGTVAVTGRAFHSTKFPSLKHVVHTGPDNVRAAISFRSLLVYNDGGDMPASSASKAPLIVTDNNTAMTEADILKEAAEAGKRLGLSADHGAKSGTVVVRMDGTSKAVAHAVAALQNQSLWVSPHPDAVDEYKANSDKHVFV